MPPKKLNPREGNAELPNLFSKFPFRIGDEVEMKSHESGYRGAWFRVQVKKIRLDRKGNIWSTMVYKDYTDESEEEIRVFEKDPAGDEQILMVRPIPPPSVKESNFNKSVHTKMCVVYRDEWEVGDLVDWWYHHCWWAAKVIAVVGDGRFQLVCPAPPGGEGGVYLANSRDLRPSLRWSVGAQWMAPPSKEIGKIPCARIVRLLDSSEVAEYSSPNQDQVPPKRGRPKLVRDGSSPLVRKEPTEPTVAAHLNPASSSQSSQPSECFAAGKDHGKSRRPRVINLDHTPSYNKRATEVAAPNRDTRVPQKRGRPRKVDVQEEVATKRRKPMRIKIIPPRQDPDYDKVEHMSKSPSEDETRSGVNDARTHDSTPTETSPAAETRRKSRQETSPYAEMRRKSKQETMTPGKGLGDESKKFLNVASPEAERQVDKVNIPGSEQKPSPAAKQIHEEKRHGVKQKRSVIRLPDKVHMTQDNQVSNGHSDEAKRRKLEHITRVSEAGEEHRRKNVQDQEHRTKNARDQEYRTKNGHDQEHRTKNAQDREHRRKKVQDEEHRMKIVQDREYKRKNVQDQEHRRKNVEDKEHRRKNVEDKEHRRKNVQDQDGKNPQKWMAHVEGEGAGGNTPEYGRMMEQSKDRKKQMKEDKVAGKSTLVSYVGDGVDEHKVDSVIEEQITLPCLSEGKENSADHISGQQSKDEKQNGDRQAEVFSSNFASNPMNGVVNLPEDYLSDGEAALDSKVLKVLNAYEEAFIDPLAKHTRLNHDPSNDSCSTGQKSVLGAKEQAVVKAYEEAFSKHVRSPRTKYIPPKDPSPANSKLAKSRECPVSCSQNLLLKGNVPLVSSTCKDISSLDTKSSTLQDGHTEPTTNVNAMMSHEFLIGTEASSMDTISIGGSPDSFSGRIATVSIEEDMKDTTSSHDGASVVDEGDSWSSLATSQVNQSRKNANVGHDTSRDAEMNAEKSDKYEFSSLRKRKNLRPVTKHKVSLSRKLIDQARREVSARRRSWTSSGRA